jgi:hypothetical protein
MSGEYPSVISRGLLMNGEYRSVIIPELLKKEFNEIGKSIVLKKVCNQSSSSVTH